MEKPYHSPIFVDKMRLKIPLIGSLCLWISLCTPGFTYSQSQPYKDLRNLLEHSNTGNPVQFGQLVNKIPPNSAGGESRVYTLFGYLLNQNYDRFLIEGKRFEGEVLNTSDAFIIHLSNILRTEYYRLNGQVPQAKSSGSKALAHGKKYNNPLWQAHGLRAMAEVYASNQIQDSAFYFSDKAIQYAKRTAMDIETAQCFFSSAKIKQRFSLTEEAVSQTLLALGISEKINNTYYSSLFNHYIAELSLNVGNLREAENYLRKSDAKATQMGFAGILLENDLLKAQIAIKKRQISEALAYFPVVLDKLKQQGRLQQIAKGLIILGDAYRAKADYITAIDAYQKAMAAYESLHSMDDIAEVIHKIGEVYFQKSDLFNAEMMLLKSISLRDKVGEKHRIYESYYTLSRIYELKGQNNEAYQYLKRYNDYSRANSTSIFSKKIEDLTQTNSREERERLIEKQEEKLQKELKEKEILQLQSDRQLMGIIIVLVIFILSAIIVFFIVRQRTIAQEQKETEMAQTLLRSQMNPHFIFNALAVIQSYIYESTPEKTSKFLVNFSRLIRLILENSPKEFITVDIEKEILSKYLTTQKLRFEDRFNFTLDIDEQLLFMRALIPPMITQPFIENSLEHGQLHTIENGMIAIEMKENKGMLEIQITDNGVGRTKAAKIKKNKTHKSMAMDITRERIEILNKKYKGKGSLSVEDLNEKEKTGTRVIICLPMIYENTKFENDEKSTNN